MEKTLLAYTRMRGFPVPGPDWQARLPRAYRARLSRMRSPGARVRTLAGLRLLEVAAGADLEALGRDANGRPVLSEGPAFSISHSGDYCVCAVAASGRVGVDIERQRPIELSRLGRLLSAEERVAAERDYRAFFPAWTAREATVKATGRVGLRRIAQVTVGDDDTATLDGKKFHRQRPRFAAGYATCLASDRPQPVADVQNLSGKC